MVKVEKFSTASFDVDPQRSFTPLCPDELPVAKGDQIAQELNAQAHFACYRLLSKECHPAKAPWIANSPDEIMTPVGGDYPDLDLKWPAHCVVGSEGNRLIPGLPDETDYDLLIEKGTDPLKHPYGSCYYDLGEHESTGLIEWLDKRQIKAVIVGGLATDYCVKTTVVQLCQAGFHVIVNLAACRGVSAETTATACEKMRSAGAELITDSGKLEQL